MNVLVVFYSRRGNTERLALAAGVGAIQARANIRLRRLPDLAEPAIIAHDSAWTENLERMKKDYIGPRDIDAEWAHALILAAPSDCEAEMQQYLTTAKLAGKIAAVLGRFSEAAGRSGLRIVAGDCETQDTAIATAYGKKAALECK